MVQTTSGSTDGAIITQTSKLIRSMDFEKRKKILEMSKIASVELSEEILVAMKVNMGIPWEKLKTMSR